MLYFLWKSNMSKLFCRSFIVYLSTESMLQQCYALKMQCTVSTVTFSQSHRHLLQNIITRNLHSTCLLSAMLLCIALVSDFISIKLNLFQIYNFAQFTSIQNPTRLAHESSIKVKNTCNCLKSIHSNDVFLLEN